ncbi:MAG TPA: hypothetical protein VHR45_13745 [Thermoanaerobaculia bacterium]|nr:hypothetical protein [Thermoanaerobaculia bacterium]
MFPASRHAGAGGSGRAALVIGHPGHELRVHGWLELAKPLVLVLTDGSGSGRESRLASTRDLLARAGARPGPIFGALTDRHLYEALLARRFDVFSDLADQLAEVLRREQVEVVAGDAIEGYNPGHDVCRLVVNAALERLAAAQGHAPRSLDFLLAGPPGAGAAEAGRGGIILELDEAALARKLAAARGYPGLAEEVQQIEARFGAQSFRLECLRPADRRLDVAALFSAPFYERHGEKQVAAGIYREVVRLRRHVLPLALAEHLRQTVTVTES